MGRGGHLKSPQAFRRYGGERREKKNLRRKLLAFFGKEEKNEGNLDFFFKKGKAGRFRERKENKGAFVFDSF